MYCPKCDMEFIDGITVCTDCGGPLAESKEAAEAVRKKEQEEARLKKEQEMALYKQQMEAESSDEAEGLAQEEKASAAPVSSGRPQPARVYVDKAEKYDDLKSSASAFLIVGGVLVVFSLLCWTGIVRLPMQGVSKLIFQGALLLMGCFSLGVFLNTSKSARRLAPEIDAEKHQTEELIQWFLDTYTGDSIDREISDFEELSEEEKSLKRFQIIQDYLITGKDLPDPSYVDALSEEIYAKLYES